MEAAPDLARVAGEALNPITGVNIAYEDLEADAPDDFEADPTEHPEDEDVSMDPDEDLPWPNLGPIRAWWDANSGRFRAGTRYLVGEPISDDSVSSGTGDRELAATQGRGAVACPVTARCSLIRDPRPRFPPATGVDAGSDVEINPPANMTLAESLGWRLG